MEGFKNEPLAGYITFIKGERSELAERATLLLSEEGGDVRSTLVLPEEFDCKWRNVNLTFPRRYRSPTSESDMPK